MAVRMLDRRAQHALLAGDEVARRQPLAALEEAAQLQDGERITEIPQLELDRHENRARYVSVRKGDGCSCAEHRWRFGRLAQRRTARLAALWWRFGRLAQRRTARLAALWWRSGGSPSGVPHGSPPSGGVSGGSPSGVPHGSPPSGGPSRQLHPSPFAQPLTRARGSQKSLAEPYPTLVYRPCRPGDVPRAAPPWPCNGRCCSAGTRRSARSCRGCRVALRRP